MADTAPAPFDLAPGHAGPAIIAHGGGNSAALAGDFLAQGADFLEVDMWLHGGVFEIRHERRVPRLPLLFEKWYLRRVPRRHYTLDDLLNDTAVDDAAIFLDLKNGGADAAALLRRILARTGGQRRIAASSQQWRALRAIRELAPDVEAFYSIDVRAKLDLFLSVSDRDLRPRGVSCRHSLLTPRVVEALHAKDLLVVAWTVDDIDRAAELVGWGVDGLTTHRVAEMRAEFAP